MSVSALRPLATRALSSSASASAAAARPRVALITGASRGIGKAIALRLASDGYDVALADLASTETRSLLDELRTEIVTKTGRRALVVTGDVSVEGDVKGLFKGVADGLGDLDVMIANAGVCITRSILETTTEDLDRILGINVRGTFLCYKYAAQQMIKQGTGGRIIGASSVGGKKGFPMLSAYSSSKFAIRSLTQSAAQEWARHGITVNAYAPGPIQTKMLKEITDVPGLALDTALGFHGTPEDVSGLVSFLASEEARYITGQAYTIDGGMVFD